MKGMEDNLNALQRRAINDLFDTGLWETADIAKLLGIDYQRVWYHAQKRKGATNDTPETTTDPVGESAQ